MHAITKKLKLAEQTHMISVLCPDIAKRIKPGQFVMVRLDTSSERKRFDYHGGTSREINLIFEETPAMKPFLGLKRGNSLHEVIGPLGKPSELRNAATLCLVGQGSGIALIYNLAKSFKTKHNRVVAVIGAKTRRHLFWEDRIDKTVDHLYIATEDGSKGRRGTVAMALKDILKKRIDLIYVAADNAIMDEISKMTKHFVRTIARVQVDMLDGMGMCGGCRVNYDSGIKLSCVDGPDFDAHKLDWQSIFQRQSI